MKIKDPENLITFWIIVSARAILLIFFLVEIFIKFYIQIR